MARAKKQTTKSEAPTSSRTKHQRFDVEEIARDRIKNAPYNPRVMSPEARARLKDKISTVGLVNVLVWNRRSGNLVGGHQRLSILDELEGSDRYSLKVSVVDVDEREEKSLNVFLNNVASMGDWDTQALASIAEEFKDAHGDLGFAPGELDYLLKDSSRDEEGGGGDREQKPPRPTQNETQVVVVCQTQADTDAFLKFIGAGTNTRYVDGTKHFARFGFKHGKEAV